jgi:hypothetical protein
MIYFNLKKHVSQKALGKALCNAGIDKKGVR